MMHQRLTRGHIERVDDSQRNSQQDYMDWLYPAGQGQQCQQQRLSEGRALRPHGDSVSGVAIVDHAGDWAQNQDRDLRCKADDAQQGCRSGKAIDQQLSATCCIEVPQTETSWPVR